MLEGHSVASGRMQLQVERSTTAVLIWLLNRPWNDPNTLRNPRKPGQCWRMLCAFIAELRVLADNIEPRTQVSLERSSRARAVAAARRTDVEDGATTDDPWDVLKEQVGASGRSERRPNNETLPGLPGALRNSETPSCYHPRRQNPPFYRPTRRRLHASAV